MPKVDMDVEIAVGGYCSGNGCVDMVVEIVGGYCGGFGFSGENTARTSDKIVDIARDIHNKSADNVVDIVVFMILAIKHT